MRIQGLLVLLLLAGGLAYGLYATRDEGKRAGVETQALLEGRRLFDAERIVLQRAPDTKPMHFARNDPRAPFSMVEPIVDLASAAFLENVRGVFDSAQKFFDARLADVPAARLAEMGLDKPRAFAEVRYPDRTYKFAIGLEGPLMQDVYVLSDEQVWRTGVAVYTALQSNVDDVRERRLVQSEPGDIRKLTLRRRVGADKQLEVVEVERVSGAEFRLRQPLDTDANPHTALALFTFLASMGADQFLDELNPMPDWDVHYEIEGAFGKEAITIWKTEHGILGKQEPRGVVFSLTSSNFNRTFDVPVDDLRARVLVPVEVADIVRVELDPGQGRGERIQLQRTTVSGEFRLFQPFESEADPASCAELVQALQNLKITEFLSVPESELGKLGLDAGFLTVSVHPRLREKAPIVLRLGKDEGDATYLRRDEGNLVVKVPKAIVDSLRRPWPTYASRNVPLFPRGTEWGELRYSIGDRTVALFSRGADGKWTRDGRSGDVSNEVVELFDALSSVRGRRVLDTKDQTTIHELVDCTTITVSGKPREGGATVSVVLYNRVRLIGVTRQLWMAHRDQPRILVELSLADTRLLLGPLGP